MLAMSFHSLNLVIKSLTFLIPQLAKKIFNAQLCSFLGSWSILVWSAISCSIVASLGTIYFVKAKCQVLYYLCPPFQHVPGCQRVCHMYYFYQNNCFLRTPIFLSFFNGLICNAFWGTFVHFIPILFVFLTRLNLSYMYFQHLSLIDERPCIEPPSTLGCVISSHS